MRNLPPRMSNQPPRKPWENESNNFDSAKLKAANLDLNESHDPNENRTEDKLNEDKLNPGDITHEQHIYEETGSRITYRSGWVARGGRWGG